MKEPESFWIIYGDDPNPDYGGCHSHPVLGVVWGSYDAALDYAKTLKGFHIWGDGEIKPIDVKFLSCNVYVP